MRAGMRGVRRSSRNVGRQGSAVVPPASRSPVGPAPAHGSRVELRIGCGRRTRAPRSAAGCAPLGEGRVPPPTSAAGAVAGYLRPRDARSGRVGAAECGGGAEAAGLLLLPRVGKPPRTLPHRSSAGPPWVGEYEPGKGAGVGGGEKEGRKAPGIGWGGGK
jgi:hypothetical protein